MSFESVLSHWQPSCTLAGRDRLLTTGQLVAALAHIANALLEGAPAQLRKPEPDPATQRPAESPLVAAERTLEMIAGGAIEGERSQAALRKELVEIRRSEDCLRTILDTMPTQAWSLRADGNVAYLNQRWHEYTGLSWEEVWKGEPGREAIQIDVGQVVVHPDDAPRVNAKWRHEILPEAKPSEYELRQRRYDGEYRWFMVRVEPLRDERGNVVRWYGTNTDIEDLKRAEEKLRQDEQELRCHRTLKPGH